MGLIWRLSFYKTRNIIPGIDCGNITDVVSFISTAYTCKEEKTPKFMLSFQEKFREITLSSGFWMYILDLFFLLAW